MFWLAISKGWAIVGVITLIAVLALYKLISAKYVDQPSRQSEQIDMLHKRINHLENQLTQVTHQLEELLEKDATQNQNDHD